MRGEDAEVAILWAQMVMNEQAYQRMAEPIAATWRDPLVGGNGCH